MESEPLTAACELAFSVARDGVEAEPAIEPPASMRSFLYVAQLPKRALAVAQQVIDEDADFRARVADAATEDAVGRAGYLWLHRPDGWQDEFSTLSDVPIALSDDSSGTDSQPGGTEVMATEQEPGSPESDAPAAPTVDDAGATGAGGSDAIENELASLRELVDKLAEERRQVSADIEGATPMAAVADTGSSMSAQVKSLTDDLQSARSERDEAQQAKELSILRQAELEDEIAELRRRITWFEEERAGVQETLAQAEQQVESVQGVVRDLENQRDDLDAKLSDLNTDLATLRAERETLDARVNALTSELEGMTAERDALDAKANELTGDLSGMTSERDALDARVNALTSDLDGMTAQRDAVEAQVNELTGDLAGMTTERDNLTRSLEEAAVERARLEANLASSSDEAATLSTQLDALQAQRAAVDAELMRLNSDVATDAVNRQTQIDALTAQLAEAKAERDVLASQLDETKSILAGARSALEDLTRSMGGELDRLEGAVEQSVQTQAGLETSIASATSSLDALAATPTVAPADESLLAANSVDVSTLSAESGTAQEVAGIGGDVTHVDFGSADADAKPADDLDEVSALVSETVSGFGEEAVDSVEAPPALGGDLDPEEAEELAEAVHTEVEEAVAKVDAEDVEDVEDAEDPGAGSGSQIAAAAAGLFAGFGRRKEKAAEAAAHDAAPADIPPPPSAEDSLQPVTDFGAVEVADVDDELEVDVPVDIDDVGADAAVADSPVDDSLVEHGHVDDSPVEDSLVEDSMVEVSPVADVVAVASAEPEAEDLNAAGGFLDDEVAAATTDTFDEELGADDTSEEGELVAAAADNGSVTTEVVAGRVPIAIPEDLTDDPVAAARHVVNTADAVLLVDGDGVAQMGWPNLDVTGNRDALVSYLSILAGGTGVAPDVVLDRDIQSEPLPESRAVRVRLTDESGSVNAVLLGLIDSYPEEWPVVIVSSDPDLVAEASDKGATILDNGQLLDLFISY